MMKKLLPIAVMILPGLAFADTTWFPFDATSSLEYIGTVAAPIFTQFWPIGEFIIGIGLAIAVVLLFVYAIMGIFHHDKKH